MANFIFNYSATLRDARGQTGRLHGYINGLLGSSASYATMTALANNVVAAWLQCTNAALVSLGGIASGTAINQVLNPDQYGANTQYPNAEDKAVLTFLMANNTLSHMSIPAPIGTGANNIFLPDGETVNPAATGIVNLIAALTAVGTHGEAASTKNGSLYNLLVVGMRGRRKFQRKLTIWTLNPTETGPGE